MPGCVWCVYVGVPHLGVEEALACETGEWRERG